MRSSHLRKLSFVIGFAGLMLLGGRADAHYANCEGSELVVSATESLIAASRTGDPARFNAVLSRYADVNAIALAALGPYRRDLPPAIKQQYVAKTRDYLGRVLADNAGQFSRTGLEIQSCGAGEVQTVLGDHKITWRVRGNRVSDVEVDGVWLVPELRTKFTSVIRRGRDGIQSLLNFLNRNS